MTRAIAYIRAHRRDLRWYWLGLQVPLLALAIAFAPQVEGAVRAPVAATVNAALCRAFPSAPQCQPKAHRHV